MLLHQVSQNFGCSRISISKDYPKNLEKILKKSSELKEVAKRDNVYINFSKSEKNTNNTILTILKKKIRHVTEVPEYALENNTGDSIYVNWEKVLIQRETESNAEKIIDTIKHLLSR